MPRRSDPVKAQFGKAARDLAAGVITADQAREIAVDATRKIVGCLPITTPRTAPVPPQHMKTGDKAGRFTFLGLTVDGKALCRCDCGKLDEINPRFIVEPLQKQTRHRFRVRKARPSLRCASCRALEAKNTGN